MLRFPTARERAVCAADTWVAQNPHNEAFQHLSNSIYVVNADGSDPPLVIAGQDYKGIMEWWQP
jgi:hypothetical protein